MAGMTVKEVAENTLLQAVARVSMAIALPAVVGITTLGGAWLTAKFETIATKIEQSDSRISSVESSLLSRVQAAEVQTTGLASQINSISMKLTQVETRQTQEAIAAERFQRDSLARLDRVQDSLSSLATSVAGLTASIQFQRRMGQNENQGSGD